MTLIQITPILRRHDAVGNLLHTIHDLAIRHGLNSRMYALSVETDAAGAEPLSQINMTSDDCVLFHYSIAHPEVSPVFARLPGKRLLYYHNVTPAWFFAPFFDLEIHRNFTTLSRQELPLIVQAAHGAIAASSFNAEEIRNLGCVDIVVTPVFPDPQLFQSSPDQHIINMFRDDYKNFLFVGRLSPNKRQEDILRVFAWINKYIDRKTRLLLVGDKISDEYSRYLYALSNSLGIAQNVFFLGAISNQELAACYSVAQVFLCMSEHEGYCVPLVEAMHYQVPILAWSIPAVEETLGGCGILVQKRDIPLIAEAAWRLATDNNLRQLVITGQNQRYQAVNFDSCERNFITTLQHFGLLL